MRCINRLSSSVGITYTIGQVSGFFPFMLNSTTGNFSVTQDLVYATTQPRSYSFSVGCYDNLSPNLSSNASVFISVIEVDKYPPVVSPSFLYLAVIETTPVGTVLASIRSDVGALGVYTVVDMDVGPQGVLNYSLLYPDPHFSVDGTFGSLVLVQPFDVDYAGAPSFYNPRIQICDPYICTGMNVYMLVTAQNDHTPMFSKKVYYVTYSDGTPPGQVIPSTCTDQDIGVGALQGVVFLNTTPGVFLLNPSTGALTTNITMDYRRTRGYTVQLLCSDTGGLTNTSTVYVTITPPPNYNPFVFSTDMYIFNVSRTTPPLYPVGQINATSQIIWSTILTYSLQSNPDFTIDGHSGTIQTISSVFDYTYSEIVLNASVTDGLFNDTILVYLVFTPGNLHSPIFTPGGRSFDISELSPIGTSIATFQCTDADTGANGQIGYSITGGNIGGAFLIDPVTGVIRVAGLLILPQNIASNPYHLTIKCSDHGVPILSDTTLAYFNVYQDSNALPNFTSGSITAFIDENAKINDTVITINVTSLFILQYSFINESVPKVFTIDATTGVVRVAAHLDQETIPVYTMTVVATEVRSVGQAKTSSALLTIFIRDVNDNAPQCTMSTFIATILDTLAVGSTVLQLSCSDVDFGLNGVIVYSLSMTYGVLGINNDTGRIYLSSPLNSTNENRLFPSLLLSDKGVPPLNNSYPIIISITVTIHDPPYFTNLPASVNLSDSTQVGTIFFTATAIDPNRGFIGLVRFGIMPGLGTGSFQIFPNSGGIFLTQALDYFAISTYTLNITASNTDFTAVRSLTIYVMNTNQFDPVCQSTVYVANVPENATILTVLSNLSCSDANKGPSAKLAYRIVAGNSDGKFSVTIEGLIILVQGLKYVNATQYQLVISVADMFPVPKSINVSVYIFVQPVNQFSPVFKQSIYNQTVPENLPIGASILSVTATDDDGLTSPGGQVSYSIVGLDLPKFSIGRSGLIQLASSLDSRQQNVYNFSVLATDGGQPPRSGSTSVVIYVGYVGNRPPQFTQPLYYTTLNVTSPSLAVGISVLTVRCTDPVLGYDARVQYSLDPSQPSSQYFHVDPSTGNITIVATPPSSGGTLVFKAICTGSPPYNLSDTTIVGVQLVVKSNISFIPSSPPCLFIPSSTYNCTLSESVSPVYTLLQSNATSPGGYVITYRLEDYQTTFSIDPSTGYLRLIGILDYEQTQFYILNIQASLVGPLGPDMAVATVIVNVDNVNDNAPVITIPLSAIYVTEHAPVSTVVANFTCADADKGIYGATQFSIIDGNTGNAFSISSSGELQVYGSIVYEATQLFNLVLLCADGGTPPLQANTTVPIIVIPLNDNPPRFNMSTYRFQISEGSVPPASIGNAVVATDADSPPYNNLWYTILSGNTAPPTFTIGPTSGQLILIRALAYKVVQSYQLVVQAQDGGGLSDPGYPVLTGNAMVIVEVTPANLHRPQFSQAIYSGTIQLNANNAGDQVLGVQVNCTDQDSGLDAQTSISITGGNAGNVFNITQTGYVYVQTNLLSSQANPSYTLTVTCRDMGTPSLNNSALVIVGVTGGSLFAPQFNQSIYNFTALDSVTVGYVAGAVQATNPSPSSGGSIFYTLLINNGSIFGVDQITGSVVITHPQPPLPSGVYVNTVVATNSLGQNGTATLILIVVSVNNNPPQFSQAMFFASASEHASTGAVVTQLNCANPEDGASPNPSKYSLIDSKVPFYVDPQIGLVTVNGTLNASVTPTYRLVVICRDLAGRTSSASLTISILPYNNYRPVFIGAPYSTAVPENTPVGTPVYTVNASDADLPPYNTITFTILSGNDLGTFSIDARSGVVYVNGTLDREQQASYILQIRSQNVLIANDTSGSQALSSDTTLSITVQDVNDNYPILQPAPDVRVLFPNGSVAPNTVIATFTCTDSDAGSNGVTAFSISPNTSKLAIFPNGTLIATSTVTGNLSVEVICTDKGSSPLYTSTQLTIFTSSNNMYAPAFNSTYLYANISGDTATVGQVIGCYQATDLDGPSTPDGIVTYTLDLKYSYDGTNRFGVKLASGCVFVALPLPPTTLSYQYLITAVDHGYPARSGSAILFINVTFAVQSPRFENTLYAASVLETANSGTNIDVVLCTNNKPSSTFEYSITGGNSDGAFAINGTSGLIVTSSLGLNYDRTNAYYLQVRCTDSTGLFDVATVHVSVLHVNKYTPSFVVPVGVSIPENATVGTPVVQLNWTDGDTGSYGQVTFSIIAGNDGNAFFIADSGLVTVLSPLDRETKSVYILQVTITDKSPTDPKSSTNNITITVTDVNDNAPTFVKNLYVFQLQGDETTGYLVGTVNCTDKDTGTNAQVTYKISSASSNVSIFSLGPTNGSLALAAPISARSSNSIILTVMCGDKGVPSLTGTATVLVTVNETNRYAPQFTNQSYSIAIREGTPVLTNILNVAATDMDTGAYGLVHYSLADTYDGTFYVDDSTGQLLLLRELSYATASLYFLVAVATDGAPGVSNRKMATANITIQVIPLNRFDPCCPLAYYSAYINQNTTGAILTFGCYDNDTAPNNGIVTYNIKSANINGAFTVVGGDLVLPSTVTPSNVTQYNLVIQVSDTGSPQRQTQVQVAVFYLFANRYPPVFGSTQYSTNVSEAAPVGSSVYAVKATDQDAGLEGLVRYSVNGTDVFLIDSTSGVIFLAKALDWKATRNISFAVIAQDLDPLAPKSSSVSILVTVLNANVNPPSCSATFVSLVIPSSTPANSPIATLLCNDPDGSTITYQLIGGGGSSFRIDPNTGIVYVAGPLTPSVSNLITINITDGINRPAQVLMDIKVLFINQYAPQLIASSLNFSVLETASLLKKIGTVVATDIDSEASSLTYSIQGSSLPFYVDGNSGDVVLVSPLNYEVQNSYTFTVKVQDGGSYNGSNKLSSMATVTVTVINVNDNAPQFSNGGIYGVAVSKNTGIGASVLNIQCSDADSPPFGNPSISSSGFSGTPFNLTQDNNVMVTQSLLGGTGMYTMDLTCTDGGNLNTSGKVFIFVPAPTAPTFNQSTYLWSLPENTSTGAVYVQVRAFSSDQSVVNYTITYGNSDENFYINARTGDIILVQQLHYAVQQDYALVVKAADSSNRQSYALVRVHVVPGRGQVPSPTALLSVEQDWPAGYPFGSLQCSSGGAASSARAQSTFSFLNAPENTLFGVDGYGIVRVQRALDSTPAYATLLACYNAETPELTGTGTATVQVSFVNSYAPQFALSSYDASVLENAAILSSVTTVSAVDRDVGSYGQVTYSILAGNPGKFFIDPATGNIGVLTSLDYEAIGRYNLTVAAVDGGPAAILAQRRTGTASVIINVQDINDRAPIPDQPTYVKTIFTNHSVLGDPVLSIHCSDLDTKSSTRYALSPFSKDFVIQSNGSILLARSQTQKSIYSFSTVCTDDGGLSSSAPVTILVNSADPGYPVFSQQIYSATISEDQPVSSTIYTVNAASSPDSSVGIAYSLISGSNGTFAINTATGSIVLSAPLNADLQRYYVLLVEAVTNDCYPKSTAATVQIVVTDVNEYAPSFDKATYTANVTEGSPSPAFVAQITCTDADVTSAISYQISSGDSLPPVFAISSEGVIFTSSPPDYEKQSAYVLQVTCSDGGSTPKSATANVGIQVLPVDEYVPQFPLSVYQFNATKKTPELTLGFVTAVDLDSGNQGRITYILLDPGNSSVVLLDPNTGRVVVTSSLDYEYKNTWYFTVIARDGEGLENYTTLIIDVLNANDQLPVLTPLLSVQSIPAEAPYGYPIQTYSCTDPDGGSANLTIVNGNSQQLFFLNARNQLLWGGSQGTFPILSLILACTKASLPSLVTYSYIAVTNVARNTTDFRFSSTDYQVRVFDNTTVGSVVVTVVASPGSNIRYGLLTSFNNELPFAINETTGNITLIKNLNSQTAARFYSFLINATNSNGDLSVSLVEVTVDATSIEAPVISPPQNISLLKNQLPSPVAYISCYDTKSRIRSAAQFAFISGNINSTFSINNNGIVSLVGSLQNVMQSDINLTIVCTVNSRSSPYTNLFIHVVDTSVFPPVFDRQSYYFNISEQQPVGATVGKVNASGQSGGLVQYAITGGNGAGKFVVNSLTGGISLLSLLNYVVTQNYTLFVTATDVSVFNNLQSATVPVYIDVIYSNSRNPILSPPGVVVVDVDEYSPPRDIVTFTCSNSYGTNVSFAMSPQLNGMFVINATGTVRLVQGTLAYALASQYTFNVTCSDMVPFSGTVVVRSVSSTLIVHVNPVNRYAPSVVSATVSIPEDLGVFHLVAQVQAADLDNRGYPLSYRFLPPSSAFVIDTNSGEVFVAMSLDKTTKNYTLTVVVSDNDQLAKPRTGSATLVILLTNGQPPQFIPADVLSFEVYVPAGTPSNTQLNVTAVQPQNVRSQNTSLQYIEEGVVGHVVLSLVPVSGSKKLRLINGLVITTATIDTSDVNNTYNLTLTSTYFTNVKRLVVIVTTPLTKHTTVSGLPLAVIITIVVMASVLFVVLVFCIICFCCFCVMRHYRNKDSLKNR